MYTDSNDENPSAAAAMRECSECGRPISREVNAAADVLYGPYRVSLSGLADALARTVSTQPTWTPDAIVTAALWDWLDHSPEALIAAVQHHQEELDD